MQLPVHMQLCRLHVITPSALSLTADDPAAASERLTDLLVTCGSYRGMSHLGESALIWHPLGAESILPSRHIGSAMEAVCSSFYIEISNVAQTQHIHNVQFPVFVDEFKRNVQGCSNCILGSPVPI